MLVRPWANAEGADRGRGGLKISVETVDAKVFHVVAWQDGNPAPPGSPFVVDQLPFGPASVTKNHAGGVQAQTKGGTLDVGADAYFRLKNAQGKELVTDGSVADTNGKIVLTFRHAAGERFYGAGNEGRNRSGSLTHPAGTQTVENGATRVPFLWSTGGWSWFVANNQNGTGWTDENGVLTVTVHGPFVDLYLGLGANGYELLDDYSRLTGRAPMPPRWTFGYHTEPVGLRRRGRRAGQVAPVPRPEDSRGCVHL